MKVKCMFKPAKDLKLATVRVSNPTKMLLQNPSSKEEVLPDILTPQPTQPSEQDHPCSAHVANLTFSWRENDL